MPSSRAIDGHVLSLTPFLDHPEPELSASCAHGGLVARERFASDDGVS